MNPKADAISAPVPTVDTLTALFNACGFSVLVNQDFVVRNVASWIEKQGSVASALHDVRLTLRSLGSYRSRDLSACERILLKLLAR